MNLSKEAIEAIEKKAVILWESNGLTNTPFDITIPKSLSLFAKDCLTNPKIFEKAGLISLEDAKAKMKYMWDEGVKWGDANCEFGGETLLPKFEHHLNIILPTIPNI